MYVPVYMVCAALIVAVNSEENTYYGSQNEPSMGLSSEQETLGFLLPRLMARYRPNRLQWNGINVPPYYPIADLADTNLDNQLDYNQVMPRKRAGGLMDGPSLSISNSLDVLRNRLLLEISRKKAMKGMSRNRDLLCKIGKRTMFDAKRRCDEPEKFIEDKLMV